MNSEMARRRRDELVARLQKRMKELDEERRLSRSAPVVIGAALVVPVGYLLQGKRREETPVVLAFGSSCLTHCVDSRLDT